jgi:hypothetical protein
MGRTYKTGTATPSGVDRSMKKIAAMRTKVKRWTRILLIGAGGERRKRLET